MAPACSKYLRRAAVYLTFLTGATPLPWHLDRSVALGAGQATKAIVEEHRLLSFDYPPFRTTWI